MKICPNCDAENDAENTECFLCGFEFDTNETELEYDDNREESGFFDNTPKIISESDITAESMMENENYLKTEHQTYTPIFHDDEPDSYYNSYYAEQTSHSKVIIIVIILILIGIGIIGIIFFTNYQKKHSNDFLTASKKLSQTSEIAETVAITTTEAVKSTVVESEITDVTIETTKTILTGIAMPEKKVSVISVDNISGYPQYESILRTYTSDERCMLCDLNNDGTAELVITNAGNSVLMIYTILNNEAVLLIDATGNMSGGVSICENGIIIHGYSGGASQSGVMYKQYAGGNSLDIIEEIDIDENGIHYNVGATTTNITQAQSNEIQNKYKGMYLETVPISSLGLSDFSSEEINLSYVSDYVELGMTIDEVMYSTNLTTDRFDIKYENTFDIYGNQTTKTIYYLMYSTFKIPNTDMSDMPAVLFFEFTDNGILYNYGYHIGTDDLNNYQYSLNELKEQYSKIYDYLKEIYGQGEPVYYSNYGIDTGYEWLLADYRSIWLVVGENMWGNIGVTEITFSIGDQSLL